jgi:hypothetical protein
MRGGPKGECRVMVARIATGEIEDNQTSGRVRLRVRLASLTTRSAWLIIVARDRARQQTAIFGLPTQTETLL